MSNRHVFLKNTTSANSTFNRSRNVGKTNENQEEEPSLILPFQKDRLRDYYSGFVSERASRNASRTITFPDVIDVLEIEFHAIFNLDLQKKFYSKYGLGVVEFGAFNRSVIFEVLDRTLFATFEAHVNQIIDAPDAIAYQNEPFALIALTYTLKFINRRAFTDENEGLIINLLSSSNAVSITQKSALFRYFEEKELRVTYSNDTPEFIFVNAISSDQIDEIENNFDIVRTITSSRALNVRPGAFGEIRISYGFNVNVPDYLTTVGIIDTGVNNIEPFQNLFSSSHYDHTGTNALNDISDHGTLVAGLVVLGDEFPRTAETNYTAKAKISVIKALHRSNDPINIPQIINDIRVEKRNNGTRLFNMSLNLPFAKKYNESYSAFAYELDKLAYEEDILIFISVGNFDAQGLRDLIDDAHPDHSYPHFFYKLESEDPSPVHSCQNTNICVPSESLNNISVGALAGNLEGENSDITPLSIYPAYYSRKFHFDFEQKITTSVLGKLQRSKNLNKPDFVFEGGDLFSDDAGIEVIYSPGNYSGRTSGTSLATPLITSLAAQVLNNYPDLKTQTVKALLINSCEPTNLKHFPAFGNNDTLLKKLMGFGKPSKRKLLDSSDNSIVMVIEDFIKWDQVISMPIFLPEYLKTSGNKLKFDISLCYSFMPVKDNHLSYLPLYMAFKLVKNIDVQLIANADATVHGLKSNISWSEDFFAIEGRMFSNAQSRSFNLQPTDIIAADGSIALAIKCYSKSEIPDTLLTNLKQNDHPFSLVIRITELTSNNAVSNLYSEMITINTIENIAEATGALEADLDA
jgi:hypothetical protein